MRLIEISAPRGEAADIVKLAFDAGIKSASVYQVENHSASGETKIKDTVVAGKPRTKQTPNQQRFC